MGMQCSRPLTWTSAPAKWPERIGGTQCSTLRSWSPSPCRSLSWSCWPGSRGSRRQSAPRLVSWKSCPRWWRRYVNSRWHVATTTMVGCKWAWPCGSLGMWVWRCGMSGAGKARSGSQAFAQKSGRRLNPLRGSRWGACFIGQGKTGAERIGKGASAFGFRHCQKRLKSLTLRK